MKEVIDDFQKSILKGDNEYQENYEEILAENFVPLLKIPRRRMLRY